MDKVSIVIFWHALSLQKPLLSCREGPSQHPEATEWDIRAWHTESSRSSHHSCDGKAPVHLDT